MRFATLRVGVDQGVRPQLITLLEEPEAHLHPQAQVALHRFIQDLPGQVVVATHSSVLIGEADLEAVRILRSTKEGPLFTSWSVIQLRNSPCFGATYLVPSASCSSHVWLSLWMGRPSESPLPVLLGPLLGRDIAGIGVTILDMEGQTKEWVRKVVDGLDALGGIPWIAFVDNDSDGLDAIDGCLGSNGIPLSASHPQVLVSGKKQLEQLLLGRRVWSLRLRW